MGTKARFFIGRVALVASVLGITMLGNLRSQASERPLVTTNVAQATAADPFGLGALQVATGRTGTGYGSDADDVPVDDKTGADADEQLVPAIYAWDPDVRFVYFRHVSKWM